MLADDQGPVTSEPVSPLSAGVELAPNYEALMAIIRARKAELGMTDAALESLSGLPQGYVGKLLGPQRQKHFGRFSFFLVINALGLALQMRMVLIEDAKALAENAPHWTKRKAPPAKPLSRSVVIADFHGFMRRLGRRGGKARTAALSPEQRQRIAQLGGRARWAKNKNSVAAPSPR